jgi:hypothetical protein
MNHGGERLSQSWGTPLEDRGLIGATGGQLFSFGELKRTIVIETRGVPANEAWSVASRA